MVSMEAENRRLKNEIERLRDELKQRDSLISTLEAQIKNLITGGRPPSGKDRPKASPEGLPPKPPIANKGRDQLLRAGKLPNGDSAPSPSKGSPSPRPLVKSMSRRAASEDEEASLPPSKPRAHRRPSLDPPSRSEVEMESPLPEPIPILNRDDVLESGEGTPLKNAIREEGEEGEEQQSPSGHPDTETGQQSARRTFHKTKGAIKNLPREVDIFNADDDEVTKYSIDDGNPTYELEKTEMIDAYNARGLYTGTVSSEKRMPHGKGMMNYHHQGRTYDGDWVMGHWHGDGRIRNATGDEYVGQVVNDLKQGKGTLVYADGRVFEGDFQQDEPINGKMTFPDGAVYEGELHNGARHGYGIYRFTDGSTYEGESVMNVFEGEGKMTWTDSGWYEGEWHGGEIHGYGIEIRADGSCRHEGQWSKGVPIRL